jgi:hypothetical protein
MEHDMVSYDDTLCVDSGIHFRLSDITVPLTKATTIWSQFSAWVRSNPLPSHAASWQECLGKVASRVTIRPDGYDFLPGCTLLDLDFLRDSDPQRRIWIRAEYIRAYASIQQWNSEHYDRTEFTRFVITGHPGIGISIKLYSSCIWLT